MRVPGVAVLLFVLIVSGCGGSEPAATTPPTTSTTTTVTTTTTTSTTSTTTTPTTTAPTTTTTMKPPLRTVDLGLDPFVPPDPDPLETIQPLDGVVLAVTADGETGFAFDRLAYGDPTARLLGTPPGVFVVCSSLEAQGTAITQCFVQSPDGFPIEEAETPDGFPPHTVWIPHLEATADAIRITVDGTTYTGTALLVDDGPAMVAVNPDGSLRDPVIRRSGVIGAAELSALLEG